MEGLERLGLSLPILGLNPENEKQNINYVVYSQEVRTKINIEQLPRKFKGIQTLESVLKDKRITGLKKRGLVM